MNDNPSNNPGEPKPVLLPEPGLDTKQSVEGKGKAPEIIETIKWLFWNPYWATGFLLGYVVLRILHYDPLPKLLEHVGLDIGHSVSVTNYVSANLGDPKTIQCIEYAKSNDKAYWFESVTEIVHWQLNKTNQTRTATFQVIYVLRLLRDVQAGDGTFTEVFDTTKRDMRFTRISGADIERAPISNGKFEVQFAGKRGEVKTIITGGTYTGPYDVEPGLALKQEIQMSKNDDFWNYLNDSQDSIRELTLYLYSDGDVIQPATPVAYRWKDGEVSRAQQLLFNVPSATGGPAKASISARWENVFGGEEVGIHFSWPPL